MRRAGITGMFVLAGSLLLGACTDDPAAAPLEVSNLAIFAPLPGSKAAVAYMDIENRRGTPLMISDVSSPEFGRVEFHESVLEDGVSRMRRLDGLKIEAHDVVSLTERGKHLMLLAPRGTSDVDSPVSLHIRFTVPDEGDAEIIVRSTLKSRVRLEPNPAGIPQ